MLSAFFDETGVHAGSPVTAIAGFLGSADAFKEVEPLWLAALKSEGLEHFHYAAIEHRKPPFEHCDEHVRARLYSKLADILLGAAPALKVVGAGYQGVWDTSQLAPAFGARYPTPYSFCFDTVIEMLHAHAETELGGEQIVPIFARQEQFGPRAVEMYGVFKATGSWPLMGAIGFDEPKEQPALQMADMVLYESYQVIKRNDRVEWTKWPLLSRLWKDDETYKRCVQFLIAHNAASLRRAVERGPVPWGPGYRAPEEPWETL